MTTVTKTRVLLVDDDVRLLQEVRAYLEKLGYEVDTAEDGLSALKKFRADPPDLVVLDIDYSGAKSPGGQAIDGVEVLRRLREEGDTPVLMLSGTNISAVKVMALSIGADDYVSKPFQIDEFAARIKAILRRARNEPPSGRPLVFKRLRLDAGERRVWKDGEAVDLTGVEFDILFAMARRPNHVFSRDALLLGTGKDADTCGVKAVDVHVGHIRKKIEDDPANPVFIATVRGIGYRFEDAPA